MLPPGEVGQDLLAHGRESGLAANEAAVSGNEARQRDIGQVVTGISSGFAIFVVYCCVVAGKITMIEEGTTRVIRQNRGGSIRGELLRPVQVRPNGGERMITTSPDRGASAIGG